MNLKRQFIKSFLFTLLLIFVFPQFVAAQTSETVHIAGIVKNQNGMGVEGVSVTATSPDGTTTLFGPSYTAGSTGIYQLDVTSGIYDIHFTPEGGSGLSSVAYEDFTANTDQVLNVQLTPITHTFSGILKTTSNVAISEGIVILLDGSGTKIGEDKADSAGNFSINATPGVYQIVVRRDSLGGSSGWPNTFRLSNGSADLDLTAGDVTSDVLLDVVKVTVIVKDSAGIPMADVSIVSRLGLGATTLGLGTATLTNYTGDALDSADTNNNGIAEVYAFRGMSYINDPTGNAFDNNLCAYINGEPVCLTGGMTLTGDTIVIFQPNTMPSPTPTNTPTPTPTNVSPLVGTITVSPNPAQVNVVISATASFTDTNTADTHSAIWDWGDGMTSIGNVTESNGAGNVTGTHVYLVAGVYEITLTVTDNHSGQVSSTYQYLVVYDPSAGFVTGAGHYDANSKKAKFGIQAKYQNGIPTGETKWNIKEENFDFESTNYQWLVIAGAKATMKGNGTLNGVSGYTFLATVIDGSQTGGQNLIRFQIKDSSGAVRYDSQLGASDTANPTTVLTNGSIKVHN